MALSKSASAQLRSEGNKYYANAKVDNIAPIIRRGRYEDALKCYTKAAHAACTHEERSSALKNAATANWKIVEVMRESAAAARSSIPRKDSALDAREVYHWTQAFVNFHLAKVSGEVCDRQNRLEWIGNLLRTLADCVQEYRAACLELDYARRQELLLRTQQHISADMACAWQPLQGLLCEVKFKESVLRRESGSYRAAIVAVRSAAQDITILVEHYVRHGDQLSDVLSGDINNLLQEAEQQERICEAMQACAIGDEMFEKAVKSAEELSMEMVWDAVDQYHNSLLLARDQEVEQEAIACSRLAKVFDGVLKIQAKTELYVKRTIELAESLMPRNLHSESWFKEASLILEKIRIAKQHREDADSEEEMKQYKEELKDELTALDDLLTKNATLQDILLHIYTKHPPVRAPDYKLPKTMRGDDLKGLFKKALVHYHPDKVDKEAQGMKWFVLCSEITKILMNRYLVLKG